MTTQTVTIRRTLQASCEEVFDAWLDAEGMPRWMCPGPVTASEVDLDPASAAASRSSCSRRTSAS